MTFSKDKLSTAYLSDSVNSIAQLTSHAPAYYNVILELGAKKQEYSEMDDRAKALMVQAVSTIRQLIEITHTQYTTICEYSKAFTPEKRVKELFDLMAKEFIIDSKQLREYVTLMNKFVATQVIDDMLVTKQGQASKMFGDDPSKT